MVGKLGDSILYVAVGIPGSGKTTNEPINTWSVCPDNIRECLYGDASIQGDGKKVFSIAYKTAQRLLADGKNVYFDATNTTEFARKGLLKRLSPYASKCVALYFNIPIDVCKRRNAHRSRVVPEHVIDRMYNQLSLNPPTKDEGFDEIIEITEEDQDVPRNPYGIW